MSSGEFTAASASAGNVADAPAARETGYPVPPPIATEPNLTPAQWGMLSFLLSEAAFFGTLLVTYIAFIGWDRVGPFPAEALSLGLVICTSICLLSSSATIHRAEKSLTENNPSAFHAWWAATIVLGLLFLLGTAYEWYELIYTHGLTISRNQFGTTFFTLVGFHALHVSAGILVMTIVLALAIGRQITPANPGGVQLVSWYWHFVDGVWVVVFIVVYLL
jgi:cytochrome c oxidase subunit 3/cytochrome o ubiquinol oxidase subunit 3